MPPTRSFVLALALTACNSEDVLECPATGAPLSVGGPELQPEWGPGCIDPDSWTAEIEPANATWTVELRRDQGFFGTAYVTRMLDGVALVWGSELLVIDGEGNELTSRSIAANADWSNFAVAEDGRMVLGDQSGGVLEYRVFSPAGLDIWLRLLDIDNPSFGQPSPSLVLDGGSLWLAANQFSLETEELQTVVQEWDLTGGMQSEVVLPGIYGQDFARDGAGRFAVLDAGIKLFAAEGTPIGTAELSNEFYPTQILGLADGFMVGGTKDELPHLARIDGQGAAVWQRSLESDYSDEYYNSYVSGIALLPGGGVVAVGSEDTITMNWPDSPIDFRSQPFVVALDDEGKLTWGERLAVGGWATSVTVGSEGEVYASGFAQATAPNEYGQIDRVLWLRRYQP